MLRDGSPVCGRVIHASQCIHATSVTASNLRIFGPEHNERTSSTCTPKTGTRARHWTCAGTATHCWSLQAESFGRTANESARSVLKSADDEPPSA